MPTIVLLTRSSTFNVLFRRFSVSAGLLWCSLAGGQPAVAQGDIADRIQLSAPVTPAEPIVSGPAATQPVPSASSIVGDISPQGSPPANADLGSAESGSLPKFGASDDLAPTEVNESFDSVDDGECAICGKDPDLTEVPETSGSGQPRPAMGTNSSVQMRPLFPRISRARDRFNTRPRRPRKLVRLVCGLPSIAGKLDKKGGCWNTDFWTAAGVYGNSHGTSGAGANAPLRFRDLGGEVSLDQAWFSVSRTPDYCAKGLGWGFGFDMFWGADGPDAQVGSSPLQLTPDNEWDNTWDTSSRYGLAIPQFYMEAAWNRFAVKFGRFFSVFGYERVPAHQNFFYSHSYAFNYNQPLSLWGLTIQRQWTPTFATFSGRTTGWETSAANDDNDGKLTFFGFDYTPSDWFRLHGALSWGDPGDLDIGETDFYLHNLFMELGLTETIDYVVEHTLQTRTRPVGTTPIHAFKLYGFTNYLYWYLNDWLTLGTRYEWFYSGEGTDTALSPIVSTPGSHFHAVTMGANMHLWQRVIVRPELRYDWVDFDGAVAGGPFDNGTARSQFTYGVQSIFVW